MSELRKHTFNPPRELTEAEKGILLRILSAEFKGREKLLQQATSAKVIATHNTDYTVMIDVDRDTGTKVNLGYRIPVEAEYLDFDGVKVHILLHVVGGFMNELEFFREDGGQVTHFPTPEELQVFCNVA